MTDDSEHQATGAFNQSLASAFASGDFNAVGASFSDAAILLPPVARAVRGRDAITMFWTDFSNRSAGIAFTTQGTKAVGEGLIRENGTLSVTPQDAGAQPRNGKYLLLWVKTGDAWQIDSLMWTRNADQGQRSGRPRQGGGGQGGGGQSGGNRGGGGQGRQGGYRRGGQTGYRQGGGQGYQQGGNRPGRGGIGGQAGGVGGGGAGVGGMGGGRQRPGQGRQGGRDDQRSQNLYDQQLGLYSGRDE